MNPHPLRDKELIDALVELKVNDQKLGPMLSKSNSVKKYETAHRTSPNFMLNPESALTLRDQPEF